MNWCKAVVWCVWLTVALAGAWATATAQEPAAAEPDAAAEAVEADGLRRLAIARYGVTARVPAAWTLVERERDERAFVFLLPQDDPARPAIVACEIGVAPSDLEEYRKRISARADRPEGGRKLVENVLHEDGKNARLDVQWRFTDDHDATWYERKAFRIENRHLYTFVLNADEQHFEAYRQPFDAMVRSAVFAPPETGLVELPDGYWMHRELAFGLKLPEGWHPSFSPSEQALLFAVGKTQEVMAENMLVVAGQPGPIDFDKLVRALPDEITRADPEAKVVRCEVIRLGDRDALEMVLETQRGPFRITIMTRRFQGERLNYELTYTLSSERFEKLADELRESADSFREFEAGDGSGVL